MKKNKLGAGLLTVVTAAAVAASVAVYAGKDREGPKIILDESSLTAWHSGMTDEELLNGVRAEDAGDGDVSDTLRIEKVSELGEKAAVTYVAMDRHYNVTKEERFLPVEENPAVSPEVSPQPDPAQQISALSAAEADGEKLEVNVL